MQRAGSVLGASVTGAVMAMSLMGCSGTAPRSNAPRASESASASASASASVEPSPGALTEPGADRRLGESATVEWTPREGVDGKLTITIARLESTSYKQSFSGWKLDEATLSRAPYFVRATIKNEGETDLGGYAAPLWGLDDDGNLVEAAAFKEPFKPCDPKSFPKPFAPGDSVNVCLVMLVPDQGKLVGVSFRPYEEFDPITWEGELTPYTAPKSEPSAG